MISAVVTARLHEAVQSACPPTISIVVGTVGNSATVTFTAPGATAPQLTAGQNAINAFDWSAAADTVWQNVKDRTAATAIFTADISASAKILRATILVLLDEINILRAASVPSLPTRTVAQARTAIQNKIDGGTVD